MLPSEPLPGLRKPFAAAAGAAQVSVSETGFLARAARRGSAMASVLGSSRASGGLSGQLKCKSKRRRRRRSKRKGKLRAPLSGGRRLPRLYFRAPRPSVPSRARPSSDPFVRGRGASASSEGAAGGDGAAGSAKPGLGAAGGGRQGRPRGHRSPRWRTVPPGPALHSPALPPTVRGDMSPRY